MNDRVLLTGISGFLGGHIALQLLQQGYRVRGSVRDIARADNMRRALQQAGADVSQLEFVKLDLLSDEGWTEAAQGCRFTQHVASPFVLVMPKNPEDLIRPAVDGVKRALNAAFDAGHERVVLTSSLAAIDSGHRDYSHAFTPEDWTDLSGPHLNAYIRSKTLAEQEAWKIAHARGAHNRLAVINPAALLGTLIDNDPGTTGSVVQRMLSGKTPMVPNVILEYVDVHDVAAAHIVAMTASEAAGHRTILSGDSYSLLELANILRDELPSVEASKLPRRAMPNWLTLMLSPFDASLRDSKPFLGRRSLSDSSSGEHLLGRSLSPARDAVIATGRSLLERHLV